MHKIDQFKIYQKNYDRFFQEERKIEELNKKKFDCQNVINIAQDEVDLMSISSAEDFISSNDEKHNIKTYSEKIFLEVASMSDEYNKLLIQQEKQKSEVMNEKQVKLNSIINQKQEYNSYLTLLYEKLDIESFDQLDEKEIENYLENNDNLDIELNEISKLNSQLGELSSELQMNNQKLNEAATDLSEWISQSTRIQTVIDDIKKLENANVIPKSILSRLNDKKTFNSANYTEDYLLQQINLTPRFYDYSVRAPSWLGIVSSYLIPVVISLLGTLVLILNQEFIEGISILIMLGISLLILGVLVPVTITIKTYSYLRNNFSIGIIKRGSLSIILGFITAFLLLKIAESNLIHTILTMTIFVALLAIIFVSAKFLNNYFEFSDRIYKTILFKTPIMNKQKKSLQKSLEDNIDVVNYAYNFKEINAHFAKLNLENKNIHYQEQIFVIEQEIHSLNEYRKQRISSDASEIMASAIDKNRFIEEYSFYQSNIIEEAEQKLLDIIKSSDIQMQNFIEEVRVLKNDWQHNIKKIITEHRIQLKKIQEELDGRIVAHDKFLLILMEDYKQLFSTNVKEYDIKGQFPDVMYTKHLIDKKINDIKNMTILAKEPPKFEEINHRKLPIVFLYDFDDKTNLSEKLYDSIQLVLEGIYSLYPLSLRNIFITDFQNHAQNFKQHESNNVLSIVNDIQVLSNKINKEITLISQTGKTFNEFNLLQYKNEGKHATYKKFVISFFILPDFEEKNGNQNYFNEEMWRNVNVGGKWGFLPIFFISKSNWIDSKDNKEKFSFIKRLKESYGVNDKNIYEIEKNSNLIKFDKGRL